MCKWKSTHITCSFCSCLHKWNSPQMRRSRTQGVCCAPLKINFYRVSSSVSRIFAEISPPIFPSYKLAVFRPVSEAHRVFMEIAYIYLGLSAYVLPVCGDVSCSGASKNRAHHVMPGFSGRLGWTKSFSKRHGGWLN